MPATIGSMYFRKRCSVCVGKLASRGRVHDLRVGAAIVQLHGTPEGIECGLYASRCRLAPFRVVGVVVRKIVRRNVPHGIIRQTENVIARARGTSFNPQDTNAAYADHGTGVCDGRQKITTQAKAAWAGHPHTVGLPILRTIFPPGRRTYDGRYRRRRRRLQPGRRSCSRRFPPPHRWGNPMPC